MMNETLSIGEVARKLGLNPKTIRYYEEIGLIPPPERRGESEFSPGRRIYTGEDVERLVFIKQARLLDLSLSQIKDLLEAAEEGCCSSAKPHLKTLLKQKLLEIDEKMVTLKSLRGSLQALYHTTEAEPDGASTCPPSSTTTECVFVEVSTNLGRAYR